MIGVNRLKILIILILAGVLLAGCVDKSTDTPSTQLSGNVKVDGSSTVFPISEAVGEEYQKLHPRVRVTMGVSGTGGGFNKFCVGEVDINDASRPIKESEIELCSSNGIEWIEMEVAFDGLSVIVNPENTWVDSLTVAELKSIWEPESKVTTWKDVRSDWPDKEIYLAGPDTDSGTFDYFTKAIVGEEKASRADYTASADDNVLVQAISGEKYSLGYFGFAYYTENKDKLKLVPVDGGDGAVLPSKQTINDNTYKPLSRPLLIYINKASLDRPELKEFVKYYLTEGREFVQQVGYVKMPDSLYEENLKTIE